MDTKRLLAEARRLSDEERAALAGELIQSLESDVDADAEAAWSAEIRARLDCLDAGTAPTMPWSEARRRIRAAANRGTRHSFASVGCILIEARDDPDGAHRN